MTKINIGSLLITSLFITGIFSGCSKDHLDPSQIGRFRPVPAVNVILDTLGVAEESASAYEGAEDPRPADVVAYEQDYVFSSGDVVRITIFELLQEGYPYVADYVVNESGNISIPEIGQLQAGGLTESQLEDEIRQSLSPGILKNPSVTVSLISSQSRVFTILGDGVSVPNRYGIPRYDFRLLDALAIAGSARQFNVSYIYVARRLTGQEQQIEQDTGLSLRPVEAGDSLGRPDAIQKDYELPQEINDSEMLEVIEPSIIFPGQLVISSAEMITEKELIDLARPEVIASEKRQNPDIAVSNTIPQPQQSNARVEWIFKDGKWVPVQVGEIEDQKSVRRDDTETEIPEIPQRREQQVQSKPPFERQALPESYGWEDIQSAGVQSRVIKIPKDKLYGGDPRYNIIIKPGDTITVQLDVVGEFYVLGNTNNQGVINLTG
ncbi:MAG: polysaccharide export protein, partial [Phycisphaerae bacterium]|nr:polysaccharide export protein [Phycisphaerae bacterium]